MKMNIKTIMGVFLMVALLAISAGAQEEKPEQPIEKLPELTEMEEELGVMLTERGLSILLTPIRSYLAGRPWTGFHP